MPLWYHRDVSANAISYPNLLPNCPLPEAQPLWSACIYMPLSIGSGIIRGMLDRYLDQLESLNSIT
jgi:hypothetical protein